MGRSDFNANQAELQALVLSPSGYPRAAELALAQNALAHAAEVSGATEPTAEDGIWRDADRDALRRGTARSMYAPAWHLWHAARIEDIVLQSLILGAEQVFEADGWERRMGDCDRTTGNGFDLVRMERFCAAVDLDALRAYRLAVGKAARRFLSGLTRETAAAKPDPRRLAAIAERGYVDEASAWLLEFWGRKKTAGLVTMPLTRHPMVHVNEARRALRLK